MEPQQSLVCILDKYEQELASLIEEINNKRTRIFRFKGFLSSEKTLSADIRSPFSSKPQQKRKSKWSINGDVCTQILSFFYKESEDIIDISGDDEESDDEINTVSTDDECLPIPIQLTHEMINTILEDISQEEKNPKLQDSDSLCSTIKMKDLRTLKPSTWLNDEVYI